jgi:hypothetical protein
MRCDELKDLLPLHGLDLLGPEEESQVRRHLEDGCPRCAGELAATREALDHLPFALPGEEPSEMARTRLMARVRRDMTPTAAAEGTEGRDPAARGPAPPRAVSRRAGALIAIAAALFAGLGIGLLAATRAGRVIAGLRLQIERQEEEMATLRQQVRAAQESIRLVSGPGVLVADLAGQGPQAAWSARLFWDRQRSDWQLFASNLPPAMPGKTYQLWLITATAKVSAGTFQQATLEAAGGRFAAPPEAGPIVAAAVTDEPAGGSPQPTGSILLLGKI